MGFRYTSLAVLLATVAIAGSTASSGAAVVQDVRFTVRAKDDQTIFHIGELITLELEYSLQSTSSSSYRVTTASYDRSGRLGIERYQVQPASGWDDPLKTYFRSLGGFIGGGLSSSEQLLAKPIIVSRNLNEWVRFNRPGRYRITVLSSRVTSAGFSMRDSSFEVRSNSIWLTIVPATAEWQKATLASAVAALAKHKREFGVPLPDESVREAVAALRYLGTPAAAREMATRLNNDNVSFEFLLGLASTPAREAALANMEELLHNPAVPVSGMFLQAMSLVALPSQAIPDRPQQREKLEQKFAEQLLSALENKRGKALVASAYAIVSTMGMRSQQLPPEQKRQLTRQLVAGFDRQPTSAQISLLEYRWTMLDQETMRPLLSKIAERYQDFPELRESTAYEANELSAAALLHWWEIDPEDARAAILKEILRPKPRFGEVLLGVLPEETLPAVEQQLAQHLTNNNGSEEQIASLISRYATASVEPQVAGYLDQGIGKEACAVQTPLLAYLLRVDPAAAAASRLKQAMAARGPGFSACNHSLLVEVAGLHNGPSLQDLAIKSLNDSDPEVVANAASYLGTYGTAAAEAPLWAKLTDWSRRWKGRESELGYVPGESLERANQAAVGSNTISALACGQGWLTNEEHLTHLLNLSVGSDQRRQTEQFLEAWRARPRQIQFSAIGKGQVQIAQYQAASSKAAIEKLSQFPRGSSFVWAGDLKQEGEGKAFDDLSEAARLFGITITRPLQR